MWRHCNIQESAGDFADIYFINTLRWIPLIKGHHVKIMLLLQHAGIWSDLLLRKHVHIDTNFIEIRFCGSNW